MKFSFNLEPVLKYREGLEEEAKRIYYEAKKKVDEVLDHINELYTFIDRTRNEIQLLQSLGGKTIHDIQIREKFI
ncbi:MAG: hypothetical protein KDD35_05115, partial [Bdellovibrionales bacterium]|nr:hypothetical protein [Bdellovibrionales bacterium]